MVRHQGAAEVSPTAPVDVDLPDGGREGLALVEIPDMLVGAVRVEYGLPGPSAPDMRHDGDGFAGFRGKARGGDDGLVQYGRAAGEPAVLLEREMRKIHSRNPPLR